VTKLTLVGKIRPSPGRRDLAKIVVVALIATIFSTALVFSLLGASSESPLARYVYAKCPGIPGGEYSGGPDYIDISIDAALVAVFGLFLYLTIRDMRRKAKEKTLAE
jgi:hypothetical protein